MTGEEIAAAIDEFVCRRADISESHDKVTHDFADFIEEHEATILQHLRAQSPEAVERASDEILLGIREIIARGRNDDLTGACRDVARAALRAAVTP